ncbi:VanZ family protein [Pseudoduganella rivuli]|uniref:VanZ family protein n=1 Tax=Pseudoduganella rivuli TaxID=2666085 RepID=UPI0018A1CBBB|nr:VanZ family protein [Pseudoduganella rivuli]
MLNLLHQIVLTPAHANLRYRTALTLYSLILILGSIPGARQDIGQVASGLILHSCAYAGITFLLFTGGSGSLKARAVKAVLTVAAMGAVDEVIQSFLPYRHGAVGDWLVDVTSAIVAAAVMWGMWKRHKVA